MTTQPQDQELEQQTGEPHVGGWPLYSGLPPAQPASGQEAPCVDPMCACRGGPSAECPEGEREVEKLQTAEPLGYLSEHAGPDGPYKWQFSRTLAGVYRDTALRIIPVYGLGAGAEPVAQGLTEAEIHSADPLPHAMFDRERIDFGRAIEAACAAKWGVKLEGKQP